jgi:exopolyphosphatase/guanosine-5'-triphosphate,3'-diphosphate pyrophosphatase
MDEYRAIIDIGSNTVRLVVYSGPPRAPAVVINEKVTAKLGKEVARSGDLADKAMETALAALSRFATLLRLMDVADVDCVATAAVRDARNRDDFLQAIRKLGLSPRILSGEEEAQVSALGVIAAFHDAAGTTADLGGGSLELVSIADKTFGDGITLPLGTLRLPPLREDAGSRFAKTVGNMIDDAGWSGGKDQPLYLVGGSLRAFALYAMDQLAWPLDDPHGFEIGPEDTITLCKAMAGGKMADVPRISSSRMSMLPDAAALLEAVVRKIKPSRLIFSSWGLREGLLYQGLDARTQALDPVTAGVGAFAEGLGIAIDIASHTADWTEAAAPAATARDEVLRRAACMLALGAMRTEPNLRADQAMGWALRKRWIGLSARGRAMLAMAVLANTADLSIPPVFSELASKEDLQAAIAWGLGVRLCRRLTGTTPRAMKRTTLYRKGEKLLLTIEPDLADLWTDGSAKDLRLLAEQVGLEPEMQVLPAG